MFWRLYPQIRDEQWELTEAGWRSADWPKLGDPAPEHRTGSAVFHVDIRIRSVAEFSMGR